MSTLVDVYTSCCAEKDVAHVGVGSDADEVVPDAFLRR